MPKITPEQALDKALEVKRGQADLKKLPPNMQSAVRAAMKRPIVTQQHARRREREIAAPTSRFQKPRPERARFV